MNVKDSFFADVVGTAVERIEDWRLLKYGDDPTAPAATLVMVSGKGDLTETVPEDVPGTEAATSCPSLTPFLVLLF